MEATSRIPLLKKMRLESLRLRPYGNSLLTPAVATWLGFAWVVIFLMASVEGIVWGLVGATMVPRDALWLAPFTGLLLFCLMFGIIWIVDASLILSERPQLRARRWTSSAEGHGIGALLRWATGILVRLLIVAISLYVTAPFIAKLIRADDIAAYHQRQVEQYYAQREARLQGLIDERTAQMRQAYRERLAPVEQAIERLNQSLELERRRRAEIESEYAPQIEILRKDLVAAQARVSDEIFGRNGRPEGRGPEARKWEGNVDRMASELADKEAALAERVTEINNRIRTLEQSLRTQATTLQELGKAHQERLDKVAREIETTQVAPNAPKLSFAARSKALHALRESPEEAGVPHFETVEGFAQAALGVLFFSLIALKLFEPPAVRAYFSETIQMQYRKYLAGGLGDIPGFELPENPNQRCNPVEFARLWHAYEKDPAAFFADRKTLVEVRAPLTHFLAEQALGHDRLAHRRAHLEQEMRFAHHRREHELIAYDRELNLRTAQLQAQLANETKALKNHRRIELAVELQQAREDWRQRREQEEEALHQLRAGFEAEQARAEETLRQREEKIRRTQAESLARVRQVEVAKQLAHQQKLTELELKRRRESRKLRLAGAREELSRLRGLEGKQRSERQTLRETGRKLQESMDSLLARTHALEADLVAQQAEAERLNQLLRDHAAASDANDGQRKTGFWPRAEKLADNRMARDIAKDLKAIEKSERTDEEQLSKLREELHALQLRKDINESDLADCEGRITSTAIRIQLYEDSLAALISTDEDEIIRAPQPVAQTLEDQ
ncbi:hypothetical protein G3480_20560 [Thiorhodococcus mannitoliphagus]|uniref:DUF4407 domain-containing protein n=1 Tax=Thiorhodococcus mannitoliphagus TaxID=329406 RepID=A0A6P1DY94_9GAMM|nr:hypothetical protein [Thiorhodococcus mannitoliphagus]NEX22669.1 hypothetical protein [Thiorhodococcus mannitoliphagus]